MFISPLQGVNTSELICESLFYETCFIFLLSKVSVLSFVEDSNNLITGIITTF
jgi:hypothetical protein